MEGEFTDSSVDSPAYVGAQENFRTHVGSLSDAVSTELFLKFRYEKMLMQIRPSLLEGEWDALLAAYHPGGPPALFRVKVGATPVALVVGRHTASQVQVRADRTLSLRHALVLLSRGQQGELVTRMLDLSSSLGIYTTDGTAARSLASSGSLAVRAAETGVFVIYRSDLERMRANQTLHRFDALPVSEVNQSTPPEESLELALRKSVVSSMKRGGPYRSQLITFTGIQPTGPASHYLYARDHRGQTQRFKVLNSVFRSGCLIGRDPRCHVSGEVFAFGDQVSRLHCLLIELEGQAMLFDVASTNGTYVNGTEIDYVALPDSSPSEVRLAAEGPAMVVSPAAYEDARH